MIQEALSFTEKEQDKQLQQLIEFVSIPSISTLPDHKPDIAKAAQWLATHLQSIGLQNVKIYPTELHPVVYAEWLGAPGQPTILIYGHYDVQPVDPLELWKSHPFKPEVRENYLYARGASDDKGQTFAHLKAIEAYLKTAKKLPVNIKLLIEGEEEIGSPSLTHFVTSNKNLLKADVSLISDSHILSPTQPSIVYGLRGLAYLEIEVVGPDHDLHSGSYGGAVHNPLNALAAIISKLHNADGSIAVTGFYNKVRELTADERKELARLPFNEKEFCQEAGISGTWGEQAYTPIERLGARPTLDVNGIWGGFTGVGAKTVLPSKATAKISMRLVPDQDPLEIFKLFQTHIEKIAPKTVSATVRGLGHFAQPAIVDRNIPEMQAAVKAYKEGFGTEPLFTREGGSIPVVTLFKKQLGIDSILMGFGLPDDRLHSPNERFYLPNFYKGLQTSVHFMNFLKK